jgi:NAD(P)-dependent dehydrogenase (short-subunit alcohol dehydrogenase family)
MNSILETDAVKYPGPEPVAANLGPRLAAEGARVAVLDLDQNRAEQTVQAAGGGLATAVNVSDSRAVDAAIARIGKELGRLDIFVNQAGASGHPHYSAAKAGIIGLTRSVAKELILQGIRVNAVAPGFIDTTTGRGHVNQNRRDMALRTPAGRLGTPAEVAATVAFLVSDDASYFVGATLSPNGGLVTAV